MWSNPSVQEPIEKIRKAQWTAENTAKTQAVVDRLVRSGRAVAVVGLKDSDVHRGIAEAIVRFRELDPCVTVKA